MDPEDKAKEIVEKLGITFPVAYGLDAEKISELTGAYYDLEKKFIHRTGFLIRPDNVLGEVSYSSGPVGRFMAQDILDLVKHYKSMASG